MTCARQLLIEHKTGTWRPVRCALMANGRTLPGIHMQQIGADSDQSSAIVNKRSHSFATGHMPTNFVGRRIKQKRSVRFQVVVAAWERAGKTWSSRARACPFSAGRDPTRFSGVRITQRRSNHEGTRTFDCVMALHSRHALKRLRSRKRQPMLRCLCLYLRRHIGLLVIATVMYNIA